MVISYIQYMKSSLIYIDLYIDFILQHQHIHDIHDMNILELHDIHMTLILFLPSIIIYPLVICYVAIEHGHL